MSYISLKKKATVALLCLVSFTVGCILTTKLHSPQSFQMPSGLASLQASRLDLGKRIRGQRLKDNSKNVTESNADMYADHREASVDDERALTDQNETDIFTDYTYDTDKEAVSANSHAVAQPVSKHHYFVEVSDPRAGLILKKVISKLPRNLLRSVVFGKKIFDERELSLLGSKKAPTVSLQKKWAALTEGMREVGYEQRLPVVINIGVKKSGTNAFGFFISQHPQIVHSIGNEVHYFDWNYGKGIEYYRSRMGFSKANQFTFEKTPRYFITPDAPKNILKDLPSNVKFVICVRDPVERAKSDFRHEAELAMRRGKKDRVAVRTLARSETPASQGEKFEQTVLDKNGNINLSSDIISASVFSKHFKNWLEHFPRDRFYILSDEKVNKDIYTEMKNIENFLGLEPFFERNMFFYNREIHAPCMKVEPRPCPAKSTPGFLPKAEPSPEVIQKLRNFFRPYNQEFEKLTQMEFSWTNL
ncbi:heparan sulfate glucosamine 3-O-sulfotransferase 5-like [Acanthaster planci]|uniref:Heparan sulfate glucosamine 3-O-sulfotransferase 5-like n=1 Tax=Acanthaster planci TaxID=133434 RepID=A0A8B7YQM3_ACAPL|nr:heparan sulfate glucosamine 3-O-sulfotransferase 5-like [Acanthaster planci]XP_022095576.1 heparan sulfate glucosamine 3-O-sulfotransferase 5-like [Acanthaster planci]XP_022095577.1 heparan sulfate glucosamine 3-O-sulfotransferase 5-like [Acanthaster planci]XP_022095578.1 heparan sulfate glucosamine 3-O-sulfotransferase 5-like [Acanthaster planci]XP_022095579.1 heparan sulfate glucosamine 3-O-sulfotransferase 5-like [Acanthaster planci]